MNIKSYFNKISYNLVNVFFSQGSTLLVNIFLARWFEKEIYGQYALFLITINTIVSISGLGLSNFANRFISEYKYSNLQRASEILSFCIKLIFLSSLIFSILVVTISPFLSFILIGSQYFTLYFIISGLIIFLMSLNVFSLGVASSLGIFSKMATTNIIVGIFYITICLFFAHFGGILATLGGILLSAIIQFTIFFFVIQKELKLHNIKVLNLPLIQEIGLIKDWILPSVLSGLTTMPAIWIIQFLLTKLSNGKFADTALFNVSFSFVSVILLFPSLVNAVSTNFLNEIIGIDKDKYTKAFQLNLLTNLIPIALIVLFCILFGHQLLSIYGQQYIVAYPIFLILVISTIPDAASIALSQYFYSHNQMWLSFKLINIFRDFPMVISSIILIPFYGAIGAAIAYFIGKFIGFLGAYWGYRKIQFKTI